MLTGILFGVVVGSYTLRVLARDNTIREELQKRADKAAQKAKEYSNQKTNN